MCSSQPIYTQRSKLLLLSLLVSLLISFKLTFDNPIQRSKFVHGMPCDSIFTVPVEREDDADSCTTSSIGRSSDVTGGSSDGEDESEVQSSYKGPLDTMDALEEVLPIKRGISKFYNGKSKSFTSLADVSTASSAEDLAKPGNPYTRKRKNLLAHSNFWDKSNNYPLKNNSSEISKRPANFRPSTSDGNNNSEDSNLITLSPSCCLPPLHPQGKKSHYNDPSSPPPRRSTSWRSFSLSDLQSVAAATPNIAGLASHSGDTDNKPQ